MRNILLTIEYDGSAYVGWQMQNNGISVEGKVKNAIEKLVKEDIKLFGSGRTDSGVHALGQAASFYTNSNIDIKKIPYGINSFLPRDIRVIDAKEKDSDFHARYSAKGKEYIYVIYNRSIMNPLFKNRATHVFYKLDIEKMQRASKDLVGVHDFAGFMGSGSNVKSTVREIYSVDIIKKNDLIIFKIRGNGFLYNMVRIIVASLIDIGRGRFEENRIKEILTSKNRDMANVTAPAEGLYLSKVFY
ncbi:tRNA pseudouridine(38-40) synthase TruA [Anaerofustis sp.]|uniref:tRNA pseudouridine(38-40) synthase TruA n=1 Tax=Anaerofustis sp. TaxID=1872517 RepID=UPI0025C11570|nr:tRNA pseudouridine(38-40) synthase TruA [Anaerofustis sp.]